MLFKRAAAFVIHVTVSPLHYEYSAIMTTQTVHLNIFQCVKLYKRSTLSEIYMFLIDSTAKYWYSVSHILRA